MADLTSILGQKKLANQIVTAFEENRDGATICLLTGKSGTGKSYLSRTVAAKWKEVNNNRSIVYLEGDNSQSERVLYPFNVGIDRAREKLQENTAGKQTLTELTKGIPVAGDFLGLLFTNLSADEVTKQKHLFSILTEKEYDILLTLNVYYKESDLLIVADNFHYWDAKSVHFLNILCSGRFDAILPFLKRIRVLVIYAADQIEEGNKLIQAFLDEYKPSCFSTRAITKQDFTKVLTELGCPQLNSEKINLLFSVTNGHLEITKKLADTLRKTYSSTHSLTYSDQLFPESRQDLLEKIFIIRLQTLGADGQQIINFLEYASIIGLHFRIEEIVCLTQHKKEETIQIIERARDLNFLDSTDTHTAFSHEVIREFFLCRIQSKKSTYYKKFAECLGILRPAEYTNRADLLFEAGALKESLILYAVGYIKCIRDGIPIPTLTKSRLLKLSADHKLDAFIKSISTAYQQFHEGKYDLAKRELKEIEDIYPEVLLAEKYYLLSLCLPKNLDRHDLIESKNCLLSWDGLKSSETEIWIRLMLTLISRNAHLNEYEEAAAIERKIMMLLSERSAFDPSAIYNLNVLRRKASILHISEIAKKRTEAAIDYFQQVIPGGAYLYPIQYYMALVNHAGNLICCGEFETAYNIAKQIFLLKESTREILFTRNEVATNNFILAGFFSSNLLPEKCIELYEVLFSSLDRSEERVLLRTNYAIFKAMANSVNEAYIELEKLWAFIKEGTREDSYYEYYVQINRFAIHYLNGKTESAIEILNSCKTKIPSTPDKQFLKRRHELIEQNYILFTGSDPMSWNKFLFTHYPNELGPSWTFFGHGFLFTDMQFWSDS
jgi:hypothetical protein